MSNKNKIYNYMFIFSSSMLTLLSILIGSPLISSLIYLFNFSLSFIIIYKIKKIYILSLSSLFFIFFNVYTLIPVLNYLILGEGISFGVVQTFFADPEHIHFVNFTNLTMVGSLAFAFIINKRNERNYKRWSIPLSIASIFVIVSIVMYFLAMYLNGAIEYVLLNRGFLYQEMKGEVYIKYLMYVGIYYFMKEINFNRKVISVITIVSLLIYIAFLLLVGFRGQVLILIIIMLSGFYSKRPIKINYKHITIILVMLILFIFSSVYRSLPDKDFSRVVEVLKNNPLFFNLGSIEYGASYMNYTVASNNDFTYDYPLQSYFVELKNGVISYIDPSLKEKNPILIYRDLFFMDRYLSSGNYGGTGYSLILDSVLNLSKYLFWLSFIAVGIFTSYIDNKINKHGKIFEVYYILLIPYFIQIGRSGLPIAIYITKFIHTIILFILLTLLLNKNSLRRKC
ncbi:oligosaccharide repeat unit polymerase [Vallitalea pronyensis]|uniref:Oligosaccharide repeat unit polymerase n=1 Tax=Vallitalea pronyensis TaxID=1348613 RepID=A0A8J8SIY5_9FIRM|nr:O-antigen polymerase [Vallitalea pronyensis]QUI25003.1 oligosaccharide repeat unit polymerase [Vallitalea pronyensis]